jgi:hypothetical protein
MARVFGRRRTRGSPPRRCPDGCPLPPLHAPSASPRARRRDGPRGRPADRHPARAGSAAALHAVLSVGDDETGPPPRWPPTWGRLNRLGVDPAACDHPRDHRVRVPHLTRAELVAAPHGSGDPRDQVEHAPSALLLVAESPRAVDGLGYIRYVATGAEPDLVAEDPKSGRPASADGPSATTPRSLPLQSWTGACSITNVPSGPSTCSAEW